MLRHCESLMSDRPSEAMCNRGGSLYSPIGQAGWLLSGTPTCGFLPSVHFFYLNCHQSSVEIKQNLRTTNNKALIAMFCPVLLLCYCPHQTGCCCDLSLNIIGGSVWGETRGVRGWSVHIGPASEWCQGISPLSLCLCTKMLSSYVLCYLCIPLAIFSSSFNVWNINDDEQQHTTLLMPVSAPCVVLSAPSSPPSLAPPVPPPALSSPCRLVLSQCQAPGEATCETPALSDWAGLSTQANVTRKWLISQGVTSVSCQNV